MDARIVSVLVSQWRRVATLVAVIAGGCLVLAVQDASADGVPIKVRFGGDAGSTRVVLDVAQQVDGRVVGSDSGRQLVLEFPRLSVDRASGQGQGLVKDWALERSGAGARLTLNLAQTGQVERRFSLAPSDGVAFYRYVVDVRSALAAAAPQPAPAPVAQPVVARAAAAAAAPATAPARPSAVRRENARKVIVIDAGHGGHDSGALGDHHQEKEITLAAARALKARLERTGRYKVVLTRSDDTFIPLEERVRISRAAHADLFISLHADSGESASTRGASVYTLSDKGSDRVARNASSNSNWAINAGPAGADQAVREILFDLTQRFTRNKSAAFAEILVQKVGADRPMLTRAHRDAGYVVLFAPDVPAVLLEMGFITNDADEALLVDPKKRDVLCESIAHSIEAYFSGQVVTASL